MNLLSWYVILYLCSVLFGILLCLGSIFGGHHDGGHHGAADGHHDVGHGHDHDGDGAHGAIAWMLYAIGSGSVPTGMAAALSSLLFGAAGLLSAQLLQGLLPSWAVGIISLLAAMGTVILLSRRICAALGRHFPTFETVEVTPEKLVGASGTAVTDISATGGYAGIRDDQGSYHVRTVRACEGDLHKGQKILVVSYDVEAKIHGVIAEPTP